MVCHTVKDVKNGEEVRPIVRSSVASKQDGYEDFLSEIITEACMTIMPTRRTFNVDDVRTCKILGSGTLSSTVLRGMVFKRAVESDITSAKDAKIAVFSCPFDIGTTETKGTVLIKNADELKKFSIDEELLIEQQVRLRTIFSNLRLYLIVTIRTHVVQRTDFTSCRQHYLSCKSILHYLS